MSVACAPTVQAVICDRPGPSTPVHSPSLQATTEVPELDFAETPASAESLPLTPGRSLLKEEHHDSVCGLETPTPSRTMIVTFGPPAVQNVLDVVDSLPTIESKDRRDTAHQPRCEPLRFSRDSLKFLEIGRDHWLENANACILPSSTIIDMKFTPSNFRPRYHEFRQVRNPSVSQAASEVLTHANTNKCAVRDLRNKALAQILPYDAVRRLQIDSNHCISSLQKDPFDSRCKQSCTWKSHDTDRLLKDIVKISKSLDIEIAAPLMQRMIGKATCSRYHRVKALKTLEQLLDSSKSDHKGKEYVSKLSWKGSESTKKWLIALLLIKTLPNDVLSTTTERDESSTEHSVTDVASVPCADSTVIDGVDEGKNQVVSEVGQTENKPLLKQYENRTSLGTALNQAFIPYLSAKAARITTEAAVRKSLLKSLGKRDKELAGYIYIYWIPGNFGYVKIGLTTRDIDKRLKEWQRQCGHDGQSHDLIGAMGADSTNLVPILHVNRVEHLIHTELRVHRRKETGCKKCGKEHKEWFEISPGHARKVAMKWAGWMTKHLPYDSQKMIEARAKTKLEQMEAQSKMSDEVNRSPSAVHRKATVPSKTVPVPVTDVTDQLAASITEEELASLCQPTKIDQIPKAPFRPQNKLVTHSTHSMMTRSKARRMTVSAMAPKPGLRLTKSRQLEKSA